MAHDPVIYLASRSSRRCALLEQIGVAFQVIPAGIVEAGIVARTPARTVRLRAEAKARAGAAWIADRGWVSLPVLAADTEVVVDGDTLGQPADRAEAAAMLARLAGRRHRVVTGVAVYDGNVMRYAVSTSHLKMAPLSAREIDVYCDSGEPLGKAGGYAIQGRAGAFIAHLAGSYSGVVGLPLYETRGLLQAVGAH